MGVRSQQKGLADRRIELEIASSDEVIIGHHPLRGRRPKSKPIH